MIEKAKEFAKKAHAGQKRWSGADYYEDHLLAVYEIVDEILDENKMKNYFYCTTITKEAILVASLLHDIIEDTSITYDVISNEFGFDVAEIVQLLTRPREMEYADYIFSIMDGPYPYKIAAAIIKKADLLHNSSNFPVDKRNNKYSKYLLSMRLMDNFLDEC